LHAVELDEHLVALLRSEFQNELKFHVHHGDVLSMDWSQWGPAIIVGNLPYYITSPIIERFLGLPAEYEIAVFLTQAEVADRLRASPGSRDYGYLTVETQLICDVELVTRVPPGAFSPPPKVQSAVVRLTRKKTALDNRQELLRFVSCCFSKKRKTLRNNLRGFYPLQVIDSLPEAKLRAEQLTIEQLADLERRLSPHALGALPEQQADRL
jgi:16S rRNA (adenine1518-N6/adenine1519-N6)-dimethyltransferase